MDDISPPALFAITAIICFTIAVIIYDVYCSVRTKRWNDKAWGRCKRKRRK